MSCCWGGSEPKPIVLNDNRYAGLIVNRGHMDDYRYNGYNISPNPKVIKFKCAFLGASNVGKTTLYRKLAGLGETAETTTTVMDSITIDLDLNVNEKQVAAVLLDTAGQERFKAMTSNYLQNVAVIIAVFSFDNMEKSYKQLEQYLYMRDRCPRSVVIVYCNKSDLQCANLKDTEELFKTLSERLPRQNIHVIKACSFYTESVASFRSDLEHALQRFISNTSNQRS